LLPAELALARLPSGRHGLPRDFVARNQRTRVVAAMLQVLPQRGFATTTITDLTREAGVSRAAFYSQFDGKEECFLATYDLATGWLCDEASQAVDPDANWPERVRAGLAAILDLLAANPPLACLVAVEAPRAGEAARKRQRSFLAHFAEVLRAGRDDRAELPVDLEELLLGGAIALVARYVETARADRLPEARAQLLEYLLIPYLGRSETRRFTAQAA
jgi:AcrR family transcriptional regulator